MIVSPEAAEDMRRALEAEATLGMSAAHALEREIDAVLEALAGASASPAIARRRIGESTWAVLFVVEPRRVVVVALLRSRSKSM